MSQVPKTLLEALIKRKVFLVKGYSETLEESNSDNFYINCYYTFFLSIAGGAYKESEIVTIEQPAATDLEQILRQEELDFGILVYIGHGATQSDNQLFQLNENEIIKAGQFIITAKKQLIILESCRSKREDVLTVDLVDKIPKFKYGGIVRSPINKNKAREIYNNYLKDCKDGVAICFACSNDQTANNYYFSIGLIQNAFNWHLESGNHHVVLSIDTLMNYLSEELPKFSKETNGEIQKPEMKGFYNYPFAVSKF